MLLVLDWAMKFLPRIFRESQTDWFGKRRTSWHLTVATRKNKDGDNEKVTFVHVFENCNQDSSIVVGGPGTLFKCETHLKSLPGPPTTILHKKFKMNFLCRNGCHPMVPLGMLFFCNFVIDITDT